MGIVKAFLIGSVSLLMLGPLAASGQTFRVQIFSAGQRAEAAGRMTSKPAPRSTVITVDTDAYVEGVLAGEAAILRNRAALQAMAILARTWALGNRGRHRTQGFDFCSLTHCQVFRLPRGPKRRYSPKIIDAVRSTENLVLEYRGRLADPYFTADCGGETESAGNVWPDRSQPYLVGVPDPYCAASAHSSWQRNIPLERVTTLLRNEMGLPMLGPASALTVASRDSSGRARTLEVLADGRFEIDANQFRYAVGRELGWDILQSNLYTVERSGDSLVFSGRGLGHGVGLCQGGADAMAGLGISFKEILAHYFPGTTVGAFRKGGKPGPDPVASSEHFELAYAEGQRRWVSHALNQLENWRRVMAQYGSPDARRIHVETWQTTVEFIRATGEPGWVAGSSDGQSIFLQPLATLARQGILDSTLRHELTHLTLLRRCAPGVPGWFEEGFVLYLTGEHIDSAQPHSSGRTVGQALARPRSAAEMRAAYARSALLVRQLAGRRGLNALWQLLEHPSPTDLAWLRSEEAKPLAP